MARADFKMFVFGQFVIHWIYALSARDTAPKREPWHSGLMPCEWKKSFGAISPCHVGDRQEPARYDRGQWVEMFESAGVALWHCFDGGIEPFSRGVKGIRLPRLVV